MKKNQGTNFKEEKMKVKIYISGGITGVEHYKENFMKAEEMFKNGIGKENYKD